MLGTDFELFLSDGEKPLSAGVLHLPDKQDTPITLTDAHGPAGFIHRDNLMIEMCTPAVNTGQELANAVSRVIEAGMTWVTNRLQRQTVIWPESQATFNNFWLNSPEGRELGCDADFIVMDNDSVKRPPLNAGMLRDKRFSGGHIHISWTRDYIPAWVGARLCDLFIGYPEADYLNQERAQFYGATSLHRPTHYPDGGKGVEYRVLDSYWVRSKEALERVTNSAERVMQLLEKADVEVIHRLMNLHEFPAHAPLIVQVPKATRHEVHFEACRMAAEAGYV